MHFRPVLVLTACAALAATLAGAPVQAAVAPESTPVLNPEPVPSSAVAVQALDEVQAVVSGKSNRDMTLALRELRAHRDELAGADRVQATALLRRPGGDQWRDFDLVRVHWSAGVATSGYVNKVGAIADTVLKTYKKAGYRAPLSDGNSGGNGLLDIYLQDLGQQGLYGYCDSDDPPVGTGPFDAPAYCAFDNDYAEFPSHTPLENLQVTAAHELFHAVQFAYDYYEDGWFMEATATWAEDELYDDVDDNVQYLSESPLSQPRQSMDHFGGLRQYGDWIFFRYLTERDDASQGGMPTLVRDIWRLADGSTKSSPDDYSLEAIVHTLSARGTPLRPTWARFAAANRRPGSTYDEGSAYPTAKVTATVGLSGSHRGSGIVTRTIDHLAAKTIRFTRADRMSARTIKVELDLPDIDRGSGAVATVYHYNGRPTTVPIALNKDGDAVKRLDFGADVSDVEVTLANAGTGYRNCWSGSAWSCQGRSKDDGLRFRIRVTAVR